MAWPEPVERVSAVLREAGAEARVEEFAKGTPTAEDAAGAVGCDLSQIVKSLVFDCDGRAVLVMVPGDRRADKAKVAEAVGAEKARVAGAELVVKATGYPPGGVAPFGLRAVERVLIDKRSGRQRDALGGRRDRSGTWPGCPRRSSCALPGPSSSMSPCDD